MTTGDSVRFPECRNDKDFGAYDLLKKCSEKREGDGSRMEWEEDVGPA